MSNELGKSKKVIPEVLTVLLKSSEKINKIIALIDVISNESNNILLISSEDVVKKDSYELEKISSLMKELKNIYKRNQYILKVLSQMLIEAQSNFEQRNLSDNGSTELQTMDSLKHIINSSEKMLRILNNYLLVDNHYSDNFPENKMNYKIFVPKKKESRTNIGKISRAKEDLQSIVSNMKTLISKADYEILQSKISLNEKIE